MPHPPCTDSADVTVLIRAVWAAIGVLGEAQLRPHDPPHDLRLVEQYLRAAVRVDPPPTDPGPYTDAVAAVAAACADLAERDLPGADFALHVARSALREAAAATRPT